MKKWNYFVTLWPVKQSSMKKLKDTLRFIYHHKALKYVVVVAFAIIFIGFVDENSIWRHFRNKQYIGELQEKIDQYNRQYEQDHARIRSLQNDPKAVEKIARERYFMKTDDEDIFVLSDDPQPFQNVLSDETAE
jgi:cell division protein FtsB